MADNFHFLDSDLMSEVMREFHRDIVAFAYAVDPAGTERYATLGELDLDRYVRIGGPVDGQEGVEAASAITPSHRSAPAPAPEPTPKVAQPVRPPKAPPKAPAKAPPPVKAPPIKVLTSMLEDGVEPPVPCCGLSIEGYWRADSSCCCLRGKAGGCEF